MWVKITIIFLLVFQVNVPLFSQEKAAAIDKSDKVLYTLKSNFPVNVQNVYEYTDTSKITRTFSDSTVQKFTRILKYYFSLWAPSSPTSENQLSVLCSVDSLEYTLIGRDTTIFFNSQADDLRPPKHEDYQILMCPLGLEFEMIYSPYRDVAYLTGDNYKEKLYLLNDSTKSPSDSLIKFTWLDRFSKIPLLTYFDIVKGIYPAGKVFIDSTWQKGITMDVEGTSVVDSINFTLKSFNIKNFIIEGKSSNVSILSGDSARLFNIRTLANPQSVSGTSSYKIKLQPKGTLDELFINSDYTINYNVFRDIVIQKIVSSKSWKLVGMFKI